MLFELCAYVRERACVCVRACKRVCLCECAYPWRLCTLQKAFTEMGANSRCLRPLRY